MKEQIKNMIGITVGATLGGAAMRTVGGISSLPKGISSATQSMIGLGVVSHSTKLAKGFWKW